MKKECSLYLCWNLFSYSLSRHFFRVVLKAMNIFDLKATHKYVHRHYKRTVCPLCVCVACLLQIFSFWFATGTKIVHINKRIAWTNASLMDVSCSRKQSLCWTGSNLFLTMLSTASKSNLKWEKETCQTWYSIDWMHLHFLSADSQPSQKG